MQLRTVLREGLMGASEYKPPQDPSQLLADFYALGMLVTGPKRVESEREQLLDAEVAEVEATLLPYLRNHMLEMVGYSICCELRHVYNYGWLTPAAKELLRGAAGIGRNPVTVRDNILILLGVYPDLIDLYQEYDDYKRPPRTEVANCTEGWTELPGTVAAAQKIFDGSYFTWEDEFGGKPWADACAVWLKLYQAHSRGDMYVYIDKIYDLQHNNGAVLDKNPEYYGPWLKRMLELKLHARQPEELVKHCSPYMRKLAGYLLYARHGRGWDNSHERSSDRYTSGNQGKVIAALIQALHAADMTVHKELEQQHPWGTQLAFEVLTNQTGGRIGIINNRLDSDTILVSCEHSVNSFDMVMESIPAIVAMLRNESGIINAAMSRVRDMIRQTVYRISQDVGSGLAVNVDDAGLVQLIRHTAEPKPEVIASVKLLSPTRAKVYVGHPNGVNNNFALVSGISPPQFVGAVGQQVRRIAAMVLGH